MISPLAARRPDLLRSCVLMETSADPEPSENVGSYRRLLTLPSGLSRLRVAGARVEHGQLQVRFAEPAGDGSATDQGRRPQEARR